MKTVAHIDGFRLQTDRRVYMKQSASDEPQGMVSTDSFEKYTPEGIRSSFSDIAWWIKAHYAIHAYEDIFGYFPSQAEDTHATS